MKKKELQANKKNKHGRKDTSNKWRGEQDTTKSKNERKKWKTTKPESTNNNDQTKSNKQTWKKERKKERNNKGRINKYKQAKKHEGHLVFVGVWALWVDASVADDVAEGFGDVSSSAAEVTFTSAAVHQVLWAQLNKDPCSLLHLTLKSSHRAEGPAGPT